MKYKLITTVLAGLIFIGLYALFDHPSAPEEASSGESQSAQPETSQGQYSGLGK